MSLEPKIYGVSTRRKIITKSDVTEKLGERILKIKSEDQLTWEDMGVVFGKDKDMAMKYADGTTEMGVFAYYRARAAWGERFTGTADDLFNLSTDRQLNQEPLV